MAAANSWVLFGFDLRRLGALWRQGWAEAARWSFFRRLIAPQPVLVRHADGSFARWRGDRSEPLDADRARGAFFAAEVPADDVLFRRLRLPSLPPSEVADAVRLEVATAAPFAEPARVWGWRSDSRDDGGIEVTVAITSRERIEAVLAPAGEAASAHAPELWAFESGRPVVFQGFGEARRQRVQRARLSRDVVLGLIVLGLLVVLAASPVLQARQRVFDAQNEFNALRHETQNVVVARDRLVEDGRRLRELESWLGGGVEPMPLLGRLTDLLPDDAHLTALEAKDGVVTASGLAQNAAALMDVLGARAEFVDFRPSGISRDRATGLETFRIEFRFAPESAR